jgi:4a-hydroxytetrahydrobiopterin dehydratase
VTAFTTAADLRSGTDLLAAHCAPRATALNDSEAARLLALLGEQSGWSLAGGKLRKSYDFKNYYQTLAFVNALAWMIHAQDHHPELTITYHTCLVAYHTHSVDGGRGGLSENDFICAAHADAIDARGLA